MLYRSIRRLKNKIKEIEHILQPYKWYKRTYPNHDHVTNRATDLCRDQMYSEYGLLSSLELSYDLETDKGSE